MYNLKMKMEVGLFAGSAIKAIKAAAFQWDIAYTHEKGPGWISATHYFKFSHKDEKYLADFRKSIELWTAKYNP